MRVAVVGCGYVGLVSAVGLASVGHQVVGIESDERRRDRIAAGVAPFYEPRLGELLEEVRSRGAFEVTGDLTRVRDADVVLLAVQTPPDPQGAIDLGPLTAAARAVGGVLVGDGRRRVVATRSTVVPGTAEDTVQGLLDDRADPTTAAAANPEFLREGSAMQDFLRPDRVVVGCNAGWGVRLLEELYSPLGAPVISTTPTTAELAKYTSNAFLATLISFSNEVARICEDLPGVDVDEVLGILHRDRRLRVRLDNGDEAAPEIVAYLRAGCGYGGSCLPKDLSALVTTRERTGAPTPLLEAVRTVNDTQPARFVELADAALGGLAGVRCAVLGLAFKAGTDDLRASPALATIRALTARGAIVTAYDPLVDKDTLAAAGVTDLALAPTIEDALADAHACLVTTADPAFAVLPELVAAASEPPLVVDGRRALPPEGFPPGRYVAIGRGVPGGGQAPSGPRP